jgi:hypothetical protein
MDKKDIKKIVEDDELGLLKIKTKSSPIEQAEDRLISSFREINDFIRTNGKEPQANSKDILEFQLSSRLEALRKDKEKAEKLLPFDEFGLLKNIKIIESIEDIFADDDLGLLNDGPDSIFQIKNVPKTIEMPDQIAQRMPCKDFENFESLFKNCQADITKGKRKLLPFAKEQQISKGNFFVLKGVLLFVEQVGDKENVNGKTNARLRCIFENGTESNMLLRSLARELYKDGRRVSEHVERLLDGFKNITADDEDSGFIYVLKSKSDKLEISSIADLYKVGFSTVPVEQRIKSAVTEPTYLMAPVTIVSSFQCYNLNPQKLELLLHKFFGSACLNIDVTDLNGKRHTPREWFVAPIEVIEQAIHFILNGEIVNYAYDPVRKEIVGR